MKITAVTEDQIILVDGVPAFMSELGGYHMTNGEWAIHFDKTLGYGEIEYIDNRPNQKIDQAFFDTHYAWLEEEHQRYVDANLAEEAANDAESNPDTVSGSGDATPSN